MKNIKGLTKEHIYRDETVREALDNHEKRIKLIEKRLRSEKEMNDEVILTQDELKAKLLEFYDLGIADAKRIERADFKQKVEKLLNEQAEKIFADLEKIRICKESSARAQFVRIDYDKLKEKYVGEKK